MSEGYTWEGMEKLSREKIVELVNNGQLEGCYYLYPNNTEAQVDSGYTLDCVLRFLEAGGEIGIEKERMPLKLVKKLQDVTVGDLVDALSPYREKRVSIMGTMQDIFVYHDVQHGCIILDEIELEE